MKIFHLSTSDFRGATARGVLDLHRRLLARGLQSRFFSKESFLKETEQITSSEPALLSQLAQTIYFDENLAHDFASSFTLGFPSSGQIDTTALGKADIIHLHDIKGLLSPHTVSRILSLGKPVVWSLSDMWAFTGGCHHSLDCEGYRDHCKNCPQLNDCRQQLPALLLEKKRAYFDAPNLHLIAPSKWMARCASASHVFGRAPIHIIPPVAPHGLCLQAKHEAKAQLGLGSEVFTLLVACEKTGTQQRHRDTVKQLLESCALFNAFKKLASKKQLCIVILGTAPEDFKLDYGIIHAGDAGDHKRLSLLLNAADIAVLPHFEENGNRIILEAAACGTPVVAMNAGGVDESIRDGVNGKLVEVGDLRRMAEEISYVALHREMQAEWQKNCTSAFAGNPEDGFEQHVELYGQLLEAHPARERACAEISQPESLYEIFDSAPELLNNIIAVLKTPKPRDEAALLAVKNLRRAITNSMGKIAFAEQRIQKQLARAKPDALIEGSVVSLGKLRKYLARVLCEQDLRGDVQDQYFRSSAPAPSNQERFATKQKMLAWDPLVRRMYDSFLKKSHTARPGLLQQHAPRPMSLEKFPRPRVAPRKLPTIAVVTPSYMQGSFLEQTILSVIDQGYPKLRYAVQDAGSTDETVEILKKHSPRITSWVSEPDTGQARAVACGFEKITGDIMAWLNSDDLFMPGALRFVGEYFRRHPEVDAIYGHRVTIDQNGQEIGRWVLPPHDPEVLRSVDYVPQETLFWRESLWRKVGGISTNFRFALDWDLLLRFQKAGANIVRVPYYLGCFRVHTLQKTSAQMETIGNQEVNFLRLRTHGAPADPRALARLSRRANRQSALCQWLLRYGIRW